MSGEQTVNIKQNDQSGQRGRSTIEFTYHDLDDAVGVVQAVRDVAGTDCTWEQLAAQMKQAPRGGGFRIKVMAARMYGLLNYDRGSVALTELGIRIVDPKYAKAARVDAFLAVPLFAAAYEKLKSGALPPTAAIERTLESLGVAPKQKDKARQVFLRSAKQAGYLDLDPDRLVSPPVKNSPPPNESGDAKEDNKKSRQSGSDDLPPFIQGLIAKLPPSESEWAVEDRAKWLTTAANIFDLMYTTTEPVTGITVKLEGKTLSIFKDQP
jgi:hypothetical protein